MKTTTNDYFYKSTKKILLNSIMMLFCMVAFAQQTTVPDSTRTTFSFGNLQMPNPNSIISKYTYDPLTDRYIYTESVGSFNIKYPIILTREEFQKLVAQESLRNYYKQKIDAYDGKKNGLLPIPQF